MQCPGQDTRMWDRNAIFDVPCPRCGEAVEFFKDESSRRCGTCGSRVRNPKMDSGCAAHCSFARECAGNNHSG